MASSEEFVDNVRHLFQIPNVIVVFNTVLVHPQLGYIPQSL